MTSTSNSPIEIRVARESDIDEAIAVCAQALGWKSPEFDAELFRWKHIQNTFGRSLVLLAIKESRIVSVRPLMRWRFVNPSGGTITAARAVDTATLPEAQGQGLFRRLTQAGLETLEAEGCGFVFNTPNAKSLAGYLSMGWFDAGQVAFGMRLGALTSVARIAQSRSAADKPSLQVPGLGIDVAEALETFTPEMLAAESTPVHTLRTDHTIDTLRWRFASGPVQYRYLPADSSSGVIARVRQRGQIRELLVAHIVGNRKSAAVESAIQGAITTARADLCIAPLGVAKAVRLPKLGPTLALRSVTKPISPAQFAWTPGDLELF